MSHRLPENHLCPNPPGSSPFGSYESKKNIIAPSQQNAAPIESEADLPFKKKPPYSHNPKKRKSFPYRKMIGASFLIIVIIISIVAALDWSKILILPIGFQSSSNPSVTPQPSKEGKTASDYSQSVLTMSPQGITITKDTSFTPIINVEYEIFADGLPFDLNSIPDPNVIINRLDWNDFSITLNGSPIQFEHNEYSALVSCDLSSVINDAGSSPLNIIVRYRDSSISKELVTTRSSFTISDIDNYWNSSTITIGAQGSAYSSMQQVFDQYATVISGFVLLQDHIGALKNDFTSLDNWYSWLYTLRESTSPEAAWTSFQQYVKSNGVEDLVDKTWTEINALIKAIPQLENITENYPDVLSQALVNVALQSVSSPYALLSTLNTLESSSSGSDIESAVNTATTVLQAVYVQLASDFFGWVKSASPFSYESDVANAAQFYMDNLNDIRSLKGFYGVSFGPIIETNEQFQNVGQRGVAWWPTIYSEVIIGSMSDEMPYCASPQAPTAFPMTEVHWIYNLGPNSGTTQVFTVYLATESIVQNYLTANGFVVSNLPPTASENASFGQERLISKYFLQQLNENGNCYIENSKLSQDIIKLSNFFHDFNSISNGIGVAREYGSPENLLAELDQNTVQINLS